VSALTLAGRSQKNPGEGEIGWHAAARETLRKKGKLRDLKKVAEEIFGEVPCEKLKGYP